MPNYSLCMHFFYIQKWRLLKVNKCLILIVYPRFSSRPFLFFLKARTKCRNRVYQYFWTGQVKKLWFHNLPSVFRGHDLVFSFSIPLWMDASVGLLPCLTFVFLRWGFQRFGHSARLGWPWKSFWSQSDMPFRPFARTNTQPFQLDFLKLDLTTFACCHGKTIPYVGISKNRLFW